ncbi:putative MFS family arabinose efflux permease [Pseudonocardia hierapolitana]|uniref:Putative MFS family arabinose efflux permease n=1 Tax=Pseudonocardia hierapolitana TaxID=1128676 RepID=A0A561SYB1_9PSEU|nr:MFS transporter [Pseudonocardia hierapolitana]TWF79856.1 putative MFS family arabinose efflux permease [Pseudonocardia hierapolitana]
MRRTRWVVLGGSFLAYMFDAMEIILLSLALPAIREDLQLSPAQGGLLATATLLGIGLSSVLAGYVSDNFGRKTALIASLTTFGVFTAALAFVPSFELFMLLRFVAGFGLGGVWGVVSAYVVETWPSESRGRAAAFVLSSFPIGGVVAAVLSGVFLPDWRLMFFVAGAGVVLPLLVVIPLFPESSAWTEARAADPGGRVSVAEIFAPDVRRRTVVATLVAGLALTGWWGGSTWLPTYLATDRGIPTATVAVFMTVLNLGMFVGYNVFGLIADRIGRRSAIILSLLGVAVTLPLYALTANQTALLWFGPLFAFFAAFTGLFGSYIGELFPTRIRTTGAGFCFNVGRGVSAFAPFGLAAVAGIIGLSGGLLVCAAFFAAAGLLTFLLPRSGVPAAIPERTA